MRGPRTDGAAVHLLAAALHACQTVIAQRQIAANAGDSRSNADINTIGAETGNCPPVQHQ
ncbi:hypothetical protein N4G69_46150 [Streptomyces mirabilis]|uniref:hypothetical protein n=1 Tax=Streptomyces mirabilis TaxID=68239 RepID=UPI0021C0C0F0|nr:hypothetical protein [Streptomyces mirabilis]MCT9112846.1 hypothetical protein [Streptomyces mirabilis]